MANEPPKLRTLLLSLSLIGETWARTMSVTDAIPKESMAVNLDATDSDISESDNEDPQSTEEPSYHSVNSVLRFGSKLSGTFGCDPGRATMERHPSRAAHNAIHRQLWQQMEEALAADSSIPPALFDPPRTFIEVHIHEWHQPGQFCCPCDLIDEPFGVIELRAPQDSKYGITKQMFLQQVGEALYGRDGNVASPENSEDGTDGYKIGGETDRPIIEFYTAMTSGGILGHLYLMTRGISWEDESENDHDEEEEDEHDEYAGSDQDEDVPVQARL
jgi:hypothetical protein